MPLDGLRAWIGEVERKLGMRTRVFLVMATIAIGGAGAAIYLALDTRDDAVSESDVQALQERLERRIGAGATGAPIPPVESAEPEPAPAPEPEPAPEGKSGSGASENDGAAGGATENAMGGTTGGGATDTGNANLPKLLEEAKRKNAEAEEAE